MSKQVSSYTPSGDAVSQLCQLAARGVKLEFSFSGHGIEDIKRLALFAKNMETAQREVWQGIAAIMHHPAVKTILESNEDLRAEIAMHVLHARACTDQKTILIAP